MNVNNSTTNTSCLVCYGKKVHYNFSINKYRVEECMSCGVMRLNPQPTDHELASIYGPNYFINIKDMGGESHVAELKLDTAKKYLNKLESYLGKSLKGKLLEIGCGHGYFLKQAEARGLHVTGIEYSEHACSVSKEVAGPNVRVICGEINKLVGLEEEFDYIVLADVLEHVRNPREFLQCVYKLLGKNGIIMAMIPSLDSFSARIMKNKWVEFKPEHLWYFSTKTLRQLLYTEYFGEIKNISCEKTLSFDYIASHFDHYPIQPFTKIFQILRLIIPKFIRRYPFRVVASGVVTFAKKKDISIIKKLSVIMAVYNEELTVRKIIEQILEKRIYGLVIELIIVESNSTDKTREIINEYEKHDRIKIILQDQPKGKGNAIREGLKHVSGDFILIQDADDEYDLEDYDTLVDPLIFGEAEFVLGARHGGSTWKLRKFNDQRIAGYLLNIGHWCFTLLVNVLYGLRLKDPFTMYKVFRTDCIKNLKFECDRFDFDCELLIKLVRSSYKPIEIPVNYRSRSFKEGKKVKVFHDPLTWLRAIVKFRLQKI